MDDRVEVSILCNAYNHEKYIRDALEGFVMQKTSFRFEILIHDDASTDRTADIIREYEAKYPELVKPIYQTENQYSKNIGMIIRIQNARVKGKYVATCEGDDYWTDPLKLQKQYDFMESHPEYTLCGCSTDWLNLRTGKVESRCRTDVDKDLSLEDFLLPKNGRPFPFVSFFLRAEIWLTRPLEWKFPVGDLMTTYYAAMKGKVRMLADSMCVYRYFSEGSWTARMDNDESRIESHKKMIAAFANMDQGTDYQYHDLIQKRIVSQKYALALAEHDFAALKGPELRSIYQSMNPIRRFVHRIHCKAPRIYSFLIRVAKVK